MARLVYALTGTGNWHVHRAGCSDVPKATRTLYQERPVPFSASTEDEARSWVVDDETVEMGYDPQRDVVMYPCAITALKEGTNMTARKSTNGTTNGTPAKAAPAKAPAKATTTRKATTAKAAPAKAATTRKAAPAKASKATSVEKLHTEQNVIPSDPAQLRQLIKITRDRRWRAGRRGDAALVKAMDARLVELVAAANGEKPAPAKRASKAPAKAANGKPAANVVELRSRRTTGVRTGR